MGLHTNPVLLNVALPIGISFYTFHGMSYVFDIYRGQQTPVKNFVDYAVFVSFFPLLVAGPIERASHLLPQVQKSRVFNYTQAVEGCRLILWGMFKKVVVADSIAPSVNLIFENYLEFNWVSILIGMIGFSFQIYGDFSGYSDIALGTAKLFGFELLSNFKFPYFSRDVAEFWRRWHISLSSWFKDYLYIPLGGSRNGKYKAIRNTFIIFIVSGFWHGASWNFIAWGVVHSCGFIPLLLLNKNRKYITDTVAQNSKLPNVSEFWQMTTTFAFVTFAWVFFRIKDIEQSYSFLKYFFISFINDPFDFLGFVQGKKIIPYILIVIIIDWRQRFDYLKVINFNGFMRWFFWICLFLTCVAFLSRNDESATFIYFQF